MDFLLRGGKRAERVTDEAVKVAGEEGFFDVSSEFRETLQRKWANTAYRVRVMNALKKLDQETTTVTSTPTIAILSTNSTDAIGVPNPKATVPDATEERKEDEDEDENDAEYLMIQAMIGEKEVKRYLDFSSRLETKEKGAKEEEEEERRDFLLTGGSTGEASPPHHPSPLSWSEQSALITTALECLSTIRESLIGDAAGETHTGGEQKATSFLSPSAVAWLFTLEAAVAIDFPTNAEDMLRWMDLLAARKECDSATVASIADYLMTIADEELPAPIKDLCKLSSNSATHSYSLQRAKVAFFTDRFIPNAVVPLRRYVMATVVGRVLHELAVRADKAKQMEASDLFGEERERAKERMKKINAAEREARQKRRKRGNSLNNVLKSNPPAPSPSLPPPPNQSKWRAKGGAGDDDEEKQQKTNGNEHHEPEKDIIATAPTTTVTTTATSHSKPTKDDRGGIASSNSIFDSNDNVGDFGSSYPSAIFSNNDGGNDGYRGGANKYYVDADDDEDEFAFELRVALANALDIDNDDIDEEEGEVNLDGRPNNKADDEKEKEQQVKLAVVNCDSARKQNEEGRLLHHREEKQGDDRRSHSMSSSSSSSSSNPFSSDLPPNYPPPKFEATRHAAEHCKDLGEAYFIDSLVKNPSKCHYLAPYYEQRKEEAELKQRRKEEKEAARDRKKSDNSYKQENIKNANEIKTAYAAYHLVYFKLDEKKWDDVRFIRNMMPVAQQGLAHAEFDVGMCFLSLHDQKEASAWLKRAAVKGHTRAMLAVAKIHLAAAFASDIVRHNEYKKRKEKERQQGSPNSLFGKLVSILLTSSSSSGSNSSYENEGSRERAAILAHRLLVAGRRGGGGRDYDYSGQKGSPADGAINRVAKLIAGRLSDDLVAQEEGSYEGDIYFYDAAERPRLAQTILKNRLNQRRRKPLSHMRLLTMGRGSPSSSTDGSFPQLGDEGEGEKTRPFSAPADLDELNAEELSRQINAKNIKKTHNRQFAFLSRKSREGGERQRERKGGDENMESDAKNEEAQANLHAPDTALLRSPKRNFSTSAKERREASMISALVVSIQRRRKAVGRGDAEGFLSSLALNLSEMHCISDGDLIEASSPAIPGKDDGVGGRTLGYIPLPIVRTLRKLDAAFSSWVISPLINSLLHLISSCVSAFLFAMTTLKNACNTMFVRGKRRKKRIGGDLVMLDDNPCTYMHSVGRVLGDEANSTTYGGEKHSARKRSKTTNLGSEQDGSSEESGGSDDSDDDNTNYDNSSSSAVALFLITFAVKLRRFLDSAKKIVRRLGEGHSLDDTDAVARRIGLARKEFEEEEEEENDEHMKGREAVGRDVLIATSKHDILKSNTAYGNAKNLLVLQKSLRAEARGLLLQELSTQQLTSPSTSSSSSSQALTYLQQQLLFHSAEGVAVRTKYHLKECIALLERLMIEVPDWDEGTREDRATAAALLTMLQDDAAAVLREKALIREQRERRKLYALFGVLVGLFVFFVLLLADLTLMWSEFEDGEDEEFWESDHYLIAKLHNGRGGEGEEKEGEEELYEGEQARRRPKSIFDDNPNHIHMLLNDKVSEADTDDSGRDSRWWRLHAEGTEKDPSVHVGRMSSDPETKEKLDKLRKAQKKHYGSTIPSPATRGNQRWLWWGLSSSVPTAVKSFLSSCVSPLSLFRDKKALARNRRKRALFESREREEARRREQAAASEAFVNPYSGLRGTHQQQQQQRSQRREGEEENYSGRKDWQQGGEHSDGRHRKEEYGTHRRQEPTHAHPQDPFGEKAPRASSRSYSRSFRKRTGGGSLEP